MRSFLPLRWSIAGRASPAVSTSADGLGCVAFDGVHGICWLLGSAAFGSHSHRRDETIRQGLRSVFDCLVAIRSKEFNSILRLQVAREYSMLIEPSTQ